MKWIQLTLTRKRGRCIFPSTSTILTIEENTEGKYTEIYFEVDGMLEVEEDYDTVVGLMLGPEDEIICAPSEPNLLGKVRRIVGI